MGKPPLDAFEQWAKEAYSVDRVRVIVAERRALDTLRRRLLGVGSGVSLEAIDTAWRDWRALAAAVEAAK